MNKIKIFLGLILLLTSAVVNAQEIIENEAIPPQEKLVFQLRGGFGIGGFSPIPLPAEIREIEGFNPRLNFNFEGNATYWFINSQNLFGIRAGLKLENKGMRAESIVKNYGMEIIGDDGNRVSGNWTGKVSTKVQNSYLTLPVTFVYKISKPWEISGGLFFSYLMDNDFSGYVSEGYLREGGPTGNKIIFEGDSEAPYDFSDDLSSFSYGAQVGGSVVVSKHLRVFADFTYGFNDIFKSDFKTITFKMHPIFLNLGFAYTFF